MSGSPLRVAIVDDEESVRRALARLLRSAGMEAATYASGMELLTALERSMPDCVVLDLHMPDISGFEIMELLPPECPAVAITGHDSLDAQVRASRAVAFLRKPIGDRELLDAILAAVAP
jgi:FixJ family two-component response regulator